MCYKNVIADNEFSEKLILLIKKIWKRYTDRGRERNSPSGSDGKFQKEIL